MSGWRKSSYSGSSGGECVEVMWRKSSFSGSSGGDCVEVATSSDRTALRDSKNVDGPILTVSVTAFVTFLATARTG